MSVQLLDFLTEHTLDFSIPQEYWHGEQTKCLQNIPSVGGPIQPSILFTTSTACPALYLRLFRKQSSSGQGSESATHSVVLCLLKIVFPPVALFKGCQCSAYVKTHSERISRRRSSPRNQFMRRIMKAVVWLSSMFNFGGSVDSAAQEAAQPITHTSSPRKTWYIRSWSWAPF